MSDRPSQPLPASLTVANGVRRAAGGRELPAPRGAVLAFFAVAAGFTAEYHATLLHLAVLTFAWFWLTSK